MEYRFAAFLAVMALAGSPVSATTVAVDTASSPGTTPWAAQSSMTANASISSSQAQSNDFARKAAKAAAKKARKCAKWARKAASAHSDRKRALFSAKYNSSCVTATNATTVVPSTSPGSTIIEAISAGDANAGVIGPSVVLGLTDMYPGIGGSNDLSGNGTLASPVATSELAITQVPEPGTLALLGLGLAGLGLGFGRRRRA